MPCSSSRQAWRWGGGMGGGKDWAAGIPANVMRAGREPFQAPWPACCQSAKPVGGCRRRVAYFRPAQQPPPPSPQKMFHLLLQTAQETSLQSFVDLLQRAGEERGLLDPEDERLDDWVPLDSVRRLGVSLWEGLAGLMADACPAEENAVLEQFLAAPETPLRRGG